MASMPRFHDFFISENLRKEAEELGWSSESLDSSVNVLEAGDWGELKKKIGEHREKSDIIAFRGGDHELNRKAFSDSRVDVVLHPEKGRNDSGMNHTNAGKAAENSVAIGFSLKQIPEDGKKQSQFLNKWRRNLKLCEKYNAPIFLTTEAEKFCELRTPRDLASIINSLGFEGSKAVSDYPEEIIRKNLKAQKDSVLGPGHEVVED